MDEGVARMPTQAPERYDQVPLQHRRPTWRGEDYPAEELAEQIQTS